MNILMTNHRLQSRGGTELFVAEIAEALHKRGHEVCVFSTVGGVVAEHLAAVGVPFVQDPRSCPFRPDIIHGQHHLETLTALCCWPECPAVYFVHGATPWEEQPPRHPRIGRYLCTSPRFGWWIARRCGISQEEVVVAPNYFDARRFTKVRPEDLRTGRAAVFHNTMVPDGEAFRALRDACQRAHLQLDGIGRLFGHMVENPQDVLLDYDVVFAGGRSAIESMACGCTVIPVTAEQVAERVRPANYDDFAARNFTAEINAPPLEAIQVHEELRQIDPGETAQVTQRIRREATLERTLAILLDTYQSALDHPPPLRPELEIEALGPYFLEIAERVKDADAHRARLLEQKDRATARAAKWQHKAEQERERLKWLEENALAGSWWQRHWWRQLGRSWANRPYTPQHKEPPSEQVPDANDEP